MDELKKTRGMVKWLKENGYTKEQMQKEWDAAVEEGGSTLVDYLHKHGYNWEYLALHQIKDLPGLAENLRNTKAKKQAEQDEQKRKENQEKMDREYYENHWEDILVGKIDRGESLTENEIQDLLNECGEEVEEIKGASHRWQMDMKTVIKINGRYFMIPWRKGLTEYQENSYDKQPYEVVPHEKVITVTEWVAKD